MRAIDLALRGNGRALRHRLVGAPEVDRQDVDAVRQREVPDERLELLDLAVAARALGEDEHRLARSRTSPAWRIAWRSAALRSIARRFVRFSKNARLKRLSKK